MVSARWYAGTASTTTSAAAAADVVVLAVEVAVLVFVVDLFTVGGHPEHAVVAHHQTEFVEFLFQSVQDCLLYVEGVLSETTRNAVLYLNVHT